MHHAPRRSRMMAGGRGRLQEGSSQQPGALWVAWKHVPPRAARNVRHNMHGAALMFPSRHCSQLASSTRSLLTDHHALFLESCRACGRCTQIMASHSTQPPGPPQEGARILYRHVARIYMWRCGREFRSPQEWPTLPTGLEGEGILLLQTSLEFSNLRFVRLSAQLIY
jgi:hypothetical protein